MSNQLTCEIISVGNELLIGKVVNTNASWLADRLTKLGIIIKRITTIGDDLNEISSCIKETLSRKPSFIITTGGLGPTYDDKTLEGLTIALERKLTLNPEALEMVRRKYEAMGESLTEARVKMARMPEDAIPLHNPIGTAPAAKISYESTVIYALPGVPREMEAIFNETISREISLSSGFKIAEHSFRIIGVMESALAPIISRVKEQYPEVYVKSHPKGTEKKPIIHVYLNTFHKDEDIAKEIVSEAAERLISLVEESYGKVVYPIEDL
ncbi:MAG: nicotinamide mononucleotide deamidase-related protein [Thermoproteota archaeon]